MSGARYLLTGARGVVGEAVLGALSDSTVDCLARGSQRIRSPSHRVVLGDVERPLLGLDHTRYRELANAVDCVIHCAGLSRYDASPQALHEANVQGVVNVADFARDAYAPMVHVSTALTAAAATDDDASGTFGLRAYLQSKRTAETLLAERGSPVVVVRPSFVIGETETGYTPRFQLLHTITRLLIEGSVPVLPVPAGARVDFLPRDLVGRCIAELARVAAVDCEPREVWLTAGPAALLVEELVQMVSSFAQANGYRGGIPRRVDPDVVERLVIPAILPQLPRRAATRLRQLIGMIEPLAVVEELPCSLSGTCFCPDAEVLRRTLENNLTYWHSHALASRPHPVST